MKYSETRKKKLKAFPGPSAIEISLVSSEIDPKKNKLQDHAVEDLFEYITKREPHFLFKKPLYKDFEYARLNAQTSLLQTEGKPKPPIYGVVPFIQFTFLCMQAVGLVFLRDVLNEKVLFGHANHPSDKQIFEDFKRLDDEDLKNAGINLCEVYVNRNKLTHRQVKGPNNEINLSPISKKEADKRYEYSRKLLAESCDIFLKKYKKEFPQANIGT